MKACTCEQFSNGVVRGQPDPPAPPGRLLDPNCPKHGAYVLWEEYNRVLDILQFLNEEGDSFGKCVDKRCRQSPCRPECHIRQALERAGRKTE